MIIIDDIEQGSAAWRALHVGIPSASQFHRIITPKGAPSDGRNKYLAKLVAEYFYGDFVDGEFDSEWMSRGRESEPQARARYELDNRCEVRQVGCIMRDDRMALCSPDGLVGEPLGVEFKAKGLVNHVGAALKTDNNHYVQVMGNLLISERQTWDRVYWHPRFPCITFTFKRSEHEEYLSKLALALDLFIADLLAARKYLEDRGWKPIRREECPHGIDRLICRKCREETNG